MDALGVEDGPLPPDDLLVTAIKAGDERVFRRLLDDWSPGLLRTARGYLASAESAEDVVQDTWLAVLRGIDRFQARSSLRTWVYRILINLAKTRVAREHRTVPLAEIDPDGAGPTVDPARFRGADDPYPGHWREFPAAWPAPESHLLSGEVRRAIGAALAELPDRQRLVISLRDVQGYDAQEVCEILDISAANQRVLLHRARAAVRGRLENYFTDPDQTQGARP
ncbi:RNA polymerase sigma factor [Krasilnikovia sp. M28-CT-15]|uniref:RNA polymerase sigma factor n=1 Tax=Krasilnikovia sp. M28-CT-15 TaxID=3373540 RepID=UPI00387696BC